MAHGTQQASMDQDQKLLAVRAQCFTLEAQTKESEIEVKA